MAKRFSASSAAMIMACPASANLELAIPNWVEPARIVGGAADDGTRMHEIFASIMERTTKDLEHLMMVLEYVHKLRSTRRFKVLVEETIKATWLVSQPDTTVDLVFYTQDEIHVLDLKWGKIPVDVFDNDQLMYYALGFARLAPKAKGVTLHILQPRGGGMTQVFVTTTELAAWMAKAQAAEAKVLAGDTTFGPSDHCKFCPAYPHSRGAKGKPLCPATMQMLYPSHVNEDDILNL